ncbi:GNAT family N-acetyltransferase [Jatrophihabitans sp. DSM 45814]
MTESAAIVARIIDADTSRELRRAVLRPKLAVGAELPGDHEPGVVHVGSFSGGQLLSACLIFPAVCPWRPELPAWQLRGMATEPAAQGRGAGTAVVVEAHLVAARNGAKLLWCLARATAVSFYERNGWTVVGDEFEAIGIPHRNMERDLTGPVS